MAENRDEPMNQQYLVQIADEFFRQGCALIPAVLSAAEAARLRQKTDHYASALPSDSVHLSLACNALVLRRCERLDPDFDELSKSPAILAIAEAVLGPEPKFNAMNVIRNGTGQAVAMWHVDDVLEFPLPDAIPRFDPRMRMPVFWMTVQVALSDIDALEHGPTQYVPGTHYSGRQPVSQDNPAFEGNGPASVFCKAGDAYLTNHQCWHRGAPNLSQRTRYVMQLQYAQRWADTRFKGTA